MTPSALVNALRTRIGRLTGGLQGDIYRAARYAIRRSSPGLPDDLLLPPRLGIRLPERVVELFLLERTYRAGLRVLDIGHANIMRCHQRLLRSLPRPRHLSGIDIADPTYDTSRYYERVFKADITASGLPAGSYDLIWCVSTLEHVGLDNSGYTAAFSTGTHMASLALREMLRLLAPGGSLLVTVPYGRYENHGWFINYDEERWRGLLAGTSGSADLREWYFQQKSTGWHRVPPSSLSTVGYLDMNNAGAAGLAAALITKHPG